MELISLTFNYEMLFFLPLGFEKYFTELQYNHIVYKI